MKKVYTTIFKQCFRVYLLQTRTKLGLTQIQMAEKLNIGSRAYADLERGKFCCSAITLVFFLLLCENDYDMFLEDLRKSFKEISECIP